MLKHSSHSNRGGDLARKLCLAALPHELAGPRSDLRVRKPRWPMVRGLIGAVDPLGRVAQIHGAGLYHAEQIKHFGRRPPGLLRVMIFTPNQVKLRSAQSANNKLTKTNTQVCICRPTIAKGIRFSIPFTMFVSSSAPAWSSMRQDGHRPGAALAVGFVQGPNSTTAAGRLYAPRSLTAL